MQTFCPSCACTAGLSFGELSAINRRSVTQILCSKEHLATGSHSCPDFEENYSVEEQEREKVLKARCAFCKQRIAQELEVISCGKCSLKYCLSHRFPEGHDCPRLKEERLQMQSKFRKADDAVTTKVALAPKVRGSKNEELARKVALMQLKQKARGPPVPAEERLHLFILIESTGKKEPFYFSQTWTVGRCVDFVASELKISNSNNRTNGSRIFLSAQKSDVAFDYSLYLHEAVQQSLIAAGDTLVLKTTTTA